MHSLYVNIIWGVEPSASSCHNFETFPSREDKEKPGVADVVGASEAKEVEIEVRQT